MIIDFHTHIFPRKWRHRREEFARLDPTFREIYADSKAQIATAEELLASMDEAGVDMSVAVGFAWRDQEMLLRHNDYLRESAAKSNGRIIPFPCINMANPGAVEEIARYSDRCLGLGELRPDSQGWDLVGSKGELLANVVRRPNLILLFHVTEPGERSYPGRRGLDFDAFRTFTEKNGDLRIVGAHLGGGYYANKHLRAAPYVDTAAQPFLHPGDESIEALKRIPGHRVLFGSDFPLVSQKRALAELRRACPADSLESALGENARELLDI